MQTPPSNQLTLESAKELFQQFVDHPQLTWDHNNTGCESRADLMAEISADRGLLPSKLWIEISPGSESEGAFGIYLNNAKTELVFCEYHVAVVFDQWVIDPGFFDQPVSRDDWVLRLSSYSNERGNQCKISDSDWRNFYAPEQMIFNREKAVKNREKLLKLARNKNDQTVLHGIFAKARGEWADSLQHDDPDSFEELQRVVWNTKFGLWFRAAQNSSDLKKWLQTNPRYFGIPSEEVMAAVDFSAPMAALDVRKQYWRYIGNLFALLSSRSQDLLNNVAVGDSQESGLSMLFKSFWDDGNAEATAEWYGGASHELWDRFVVDYRSLQE